jgi:hydroxyquinol 1,2-dioxygenase
MDSAEADRLTETVISKYQVTPDPRLRELTTKLVSHLHAYIKDVKPSFEEWMRAIQFLTSVGKFCTDSRQEFILLSDVLGVSMLVDTVNQGVVEGSTETTIIGPVYVDNPPEAPNGADLAAGMPGQPLFAEGRVRAPDGLPIAGAKVDVWQADEAGLYDVQKPELEAGQTELRARLTTDEKGRFWFRSIVPKFYSIPVDGPVGELVHATKRGTIRPAHVHFLISAPGYETLITHVFVKGDPYIHDDAVFAAKPSLVGEFAPQPASKPMPDGAMANSPWFRLDYEFRIKPAVAKAA